MSTKRQRRQKKAILTSLQECRQKLRSDLAALEQKHATENCEQSSVERLSQRVKNAAHALKSQAMETERSRRGNAEGAPELAWTARYLKADTTRLFKNLEMSECEERCRLLKNVQERFRSVLPHSVVDRLRSVEASPGELVVELSEVEGRNRKAALELMRLEGEAIRIENGLEMMKIAYSNADAMAELASFENRVLEVKPSLPVRKRTPHGGFGLGHLHEVCGARQHVEVKLRTMEEELRKMRQIAVEAVNALENPVGRHLDSRVLVAECENLASKYLRERGRAGDQKGASLRSRRIGISGEEGEER